MRYAKKSVSSEPLRNAQGKAWRKGARAIGWSLVACQFWVSPAWPDVVADWNKIALHTIVSSEQRPVHAAIEMAMVHVAMFETMNFIEGAYVPRFVVKPYRAIRVSSEAAAAAAAHYVLVELHPNRKPALDAALQHSAAAIPDAQEESSALITGRALGANIYAIWASDLSAASTGGTSAMSQVRESTSGTGANAVAWYWIVGQFIEAQRLSPIEAARLYALVSTALSEAYGGKGDTKGANASERVCALCAAGAAVQVILESELGSAGTSKMTLTGTGATGAAYTSSRIREYTRGVSFDPVSGADNRQTSITAGEEIGRKIGLRALANYKPSRQ